MNWGSVGLPLSKLERSLSGNVSLTAGLLLRF
jgi:hypothetical protein